MDGGMFLQMVDTELPRGERELTATVCKALSLHSFMQSSQQPWEIGARGGRRQVHSAGRGSVTLRDVPEDGRQEGRELRAEPRPMCSQGHPPATSLCRCCCCLNDGEASRVGHLGRWKGGRATRETLCGYIRRWSRNAPSLPSSLLQKAPR